MAECYDGSVVSQFSTGAVEPLERVMSCSHEREGLDKDVRKCLRCMRACSNMDKITLRSPATSYLSSFLYVGSFTFRLPAPWLNPHFRVQASLPR